MNLNITINGKPIPKARPRLTRDGLAYTPKQTRDYERSIKRAAIIEMAGRPLIDGAVCLDVQAFFPIPTSWSRKRKAMVLDGTLAHTSKPDGSNVLKSIEDGLNGIVYADDSQIVKSTISKHYSDRPRVQVTVSDEFAESTERNLL